MAISTAPDIDYMQRDELGGSTYSGGGNRVLLPLGPAMNIASVSLLELAHDTGVVLWFTAVGLSPLPRRSQRGYVIM